MQLHLKKFDPSGISSDKVLVFIGKRNTGKSFLVRDILFYHRQVPVGTIISPTEGANKFYSNIVPGLFIHDEYTPGLVEQVVKRQKLLMKRVNAEKKTYQSSSINPHAFVILDDCLYDGCWKKDKNIRYIFMNGRHQKLLLMITMQYPLGIPPDLRTNIDYTFILRENNYNNRKRIYENYCSVFPSFEMFCQVMDSVTEGYGCLVIDNTSRSNKLEDNVFWYVAEDHPAFKVGSKEFWDLHYQNAEESGDDDEGFFDINSFKKRSAAMPAFDIKKVI
jgi:hypothetical protein